LLAIPATALGQADRGTITGTVTDSSGAVVQSVQVTATQVTTGAQFVTKSNNLGFYSLLELPIGTYDVTFRKPGFMDLNRTGIILETQHTVQVNAALQIGKLTQTVQVTGTPVLALQTEVGTNLNAQEMTDLPLSANGGRDITSFAFAATPNVTGSEWETSIGGSQAFTKSVLIDGTSADSGIVGHIQESEPSMDAVQESQVDTAGLRADAGNSGGGAFLYELKSGTNKFHGAAFGILANEFLNANTWDNNFELAQCAPGDTSCRNEYRRPMDRYYDYGFSGGGPVWKKWLGLKKMYIFAAYEKYMQADWGTAADQMTVPTEKMLTGDFSELLPYASNAQGNASGQPCAGYAGVPCPIMNGATPYTDSAGNTIYYGSIFSPRGTVYPGNIITDPISPIAQKIASIYQQDYKPQNSNVTNNFPALTSGTPWFHQTQLSFKYDWYLSDADHVAASYIYNLRPRTCPASGCGPVTSLWQPGSTTGGPLADAQQQTVITNEYRISETHTFSSHLLNVLGYTMNTFQNKSVPVTALADATDWPDQLGFGDVTSSKEFPLITFSGSPNGVGQATIGTQVAGGGYVAYNAMVDEALDWTKGRHSLKFGMEYRTLGFNEDTLGGPLAMTFSNNTFAPTNAGIQPYVGSAFANMLLGEVQSANQTTSIVLDSRRKELSFYAQDNIRINSRLTISADLSWELTRPLHVLNGKWTNFDPNATSQAFFSTSNQPVKGAFEWLQHPSDTFETYTDWHQLAPKLGGSYQISRKMVARGSVGINFVPLGWNTYSATPYGSDLGYTTLNRVLEVAPQTPAYQWDQNLYPGVVTPATGPDPTSQTTVWGPASVDPHTRQLGFTENWYAGLEYALPSNARLEVSYMGNSGRNLHDGTLVPTNFPTWSTYQPLLQSGNADNWVSDAGSAAGSGVPYPYQEFAGPAYMAINPLPQIQATQYAGVLFINSPLGQSGYNAFTVEGGKQSGSLNLNLSYNWARTTGNTGSAFIDTWTFNQWWQDPYKYKYEAHWPHTNDTVKGYLTYALPLGQGRRFLSGLHALDHLVEGWTVGTIVSYGNGPQMGAVGSNLYYPGWSAVYTNVTPGASFKNTFKSWTPGLPSTNSLFVNPASFSNPTYGQLGNSPTLFSNWRGWATPSENASLLKKTRFGPDGRYVVTLRASFFNVFNRHYWSNPNVSYGTTYFGQVTGVSGNRTGQLGARFEW
jgi:hypothetical protein